jgi:hypothetical protein
VDINRNRWTPAVLKLALLILFVVSQGNRARAARLSAATFRVDVTPPIGAPLCDALVQPAAAVDDPLSARGLVLVPQGEPPIVLVAIDWVGIGNSGYDAWRQAIAAAADTTPERVAVHTLHQHDAPGCDFDAEKLAAEHKLAGKLFDASFARDAIKRTAEAVHEAKEQLQPVTHVGAVQCAVE